MLVGIKVTGASADRPVVSSAPTDPAAWRANVVESIADDLSRDIGLPMSINVPASGGQGINAEVGYSRLGSRARANRRYESSHSRKSWDNSFHRNLEIE